MTNEILHRLGTIIQISQYLLPYETILLCMTNKKSYKLYKSIWKTFLVPIFKEIKQQYENINRFKLDLHFADYTRLKPIKQLTHEYKVFKIVNKILKWSTGKHVSLFMFMHKKGDKFEDYIVSLATRIVFDRGYCFPDGSCYSVYWENYSNKQTVRILCFNMYANIPRNFKCLDNKDK